MRRGPVAAAARALAVAAATFLLGSVAARADAELERTWSGGRLYYDAGSGPVSGRIEEAAQRLAGEWRGRRLPAIVYLHGCSGIDALSEQTAAIYARAGFLVVLPDSFARLDKPTSCDVARHLGGLHREALAWRQAEAENAVRRTRRLPFVDPGNIFLVGLSEGAIAAATTRGVRVNARIVEGWTCHAGWPEYRGLRAGPGEPVLAFSSEDDPWFTQDWARGDCGAFMNPHDGSRSIVFRSPDPLHDQHFVFWRDDVQATALNFLRAHMRPAKAASRGD